MTYSHDFRNKVLLVREQEGLTIQETAQRFQIGTLTIVRWLTRLEARQQSVPRQRKIDKAELAKDVEQYPEAYQYERAARFGVCPKAIWQALKKLGVTYKKRCGTPRQTKPHDTPSVSGSRRIKRPTGQLST